MTDRIDHAAEALRVIMALPSGDTIDQAYAYAQVHATLALVEQQRLANMIALAGLSMDGPLRHLAMQPMGEISVQPTDDIAAALGIETGAPND